MFWFFGPAQDPAWLMLPPSVGNSLGAWRTSVLHSSYTQQVPKQMLLQGQQTQAAPAFITAFPAPETMSLILCPCGAQRVGKSMACSVSAESWTY